jgi:catechol 2,3-dioxygenase-like lactoylglutathione lyase family enzyme
MDLGRVVTLAGADAAPLQLNLVAEPGARGPVPDLSIEVGDVDALDARAQDLGMPIEGKLADEPWGVRRCFLRDPAGRLLGVLSHRS